MANQEIPEHSTDLQLSDESESKVTHWVAIPSELRWVTTLGRLRQGGIMDLQMAWQCREDGRIEWRTIPMHVMSEAEFGAKP